MKLHVDAQNGSYDIHIGRGLLQGMQLQQYPRYAVVTDENVAALYAKHLDAACTIVLPPGEPTKNIDQLTAILERLMETGISRDDAVVTLGGGVVGDIGGLAAALFKRGVHLVQVPTTLLAQVDSAVGGKVAVDMPHAKNSVGTFYQPSMVVTDTQVLETLSEREFAAGMAEVVKYAYIADKSLYIWLREGNMPLERIIYRCCEIKKDYVERDPFDTGVRMHLNYGHTIGHALEVAVGYGNLLHGEAVAIGMVYAAQVGEELGISPAGLAQDTAALVAKYNLPHSVEPHVLRKAMAYLDKDKKAFGSRMRLVLLKSVGRAVIQEVEIQEMKRILENSIL